MKIRFQLLAVFFFLTFHCLGQKIVGVKGLVVNDVNEALDQVNISLTKPGIRPISFTTDAHGQFQQELTPGTYLIKFSYLGYEDNIREQIIIDSTLLDLGQIILISSSKILDAVSIVGNRPFIEQKSDRLVINVENSVLSDGMNALEILKRAPGVKVDEDGNISMRGKSDVGILINGKLSYLSQKELVTLLQGTSSTSLKSVELITNPSAKYDAAGMGGLINLQLKDGHKPGFNLAVNTFVGAGRKERYGAGINFNSQHKVVNIIGSYDYAYRGEEEFRTFDRYFSILPTESLARKSKQYSQTSEPLNTNNAKFGMDVQVSESLQLGALWSGNFGTYKNLSEGYNNVLFEDNRLISNSLTDNSNVSNWNSHNINLNLLQKIGKKEHVLAVDFDYMHADFDANQLLVSRFQKTDFEQPYTSQRKNATPSLSKLYVAKIDYLHHLAEKQRVEIGWKSSWMDADNNAINETLRGDEWVADLGTSNHFLYEEQIHAGYVNYHLELQKWNLMAGLRTEHTRANGNQLTTKTITQKEYTSLFPSGAIGFKLNDSHQFRFSYSRRINRPDYEDLNPFRFYVDAFVFWEGNPTLQPELANNFELSYSLKQNLHLSLFYTDVKDVMTSVLTQLPAQNITIRSLHNIEGYRNKGFNLSYSISPIKSIHSINNVTLYENHYFGAFRNEVIDNRQWSVNAISNNTVRFPKEWSLELVAGYQSPQSDGVFKQKSSGYVSAEIMKKLYANKMSVKIAANDLFKTQRYRTASFSGNVRMDQHFNLDSRTFLLTLSYKIGSNGKAFDKLNRKGEEQGRVRGGN